MGLIYFEDVYLFWHSHNSPGKVLRASDCWKRCTLATLRNGVSMPHNHGHQNSVKARVATPYRPHVGWNAKKLLESRFLLLAFNRGLPIQMTTITRSLYARYLVWNDHYYQPIGCCNPVSQKSSSSRRSILSRINALSSDLTQVRFCGPTNANV